MQIGLRHHHHRVQPNLKTPLKVRAMLEPVLQKLAKTSVPLKTKQAMLRGTRTANVRFPAPPKTRHKLLLQTQFEVPLDLPTPLRNRVRLLVLESHRKP
jgi:hypothetical protein